MSRGHTYSKKPDAISTPNLAEAKLAHRLIAKISKSMDYDIGKLSADGIFSTNAIPTLTFESGFSKPGTPRSSFSDLANHCAEYIDVARDGVSKCGKCLWAYPIFHKMFGHNIDRLIAMGDPASLLLVEGIVAVSRSIYFSMEDRNCANSNLSEYLATLIRFANYEIGKLPA